MRFSRDLGGGHMTLVEVLTRLEDQIAEARHKRVDYWRSLINDEVEISVEASKESYREILRTLPLLNACAQLLFGPNVSFQLLLWDPAYDHLVAGGSCSEDDGYDRLETLLEHYHDPDREDADWLDEDGDDA